MEYTNHVRKNISTKAVGLGTTNGTVPWVYFLLEIRASLGLGPNRSRDTYGILAIL